MLYNPWLLCKYNAHINVEICASVRAVKYIHKYIYKGTDRAVLTVETQDEVKQYLQGRYVSLSEALWRLFEFAVHKEYPPVQALAVHLLGRHLVVFDKDATAD